MAGEDKHFSSGQERLVVDLKGWRICPLICYDLRFPAWSRNRQQFDLLLYLANWPAVRRQHWSSLLTARAIENLCYVTGVNRTGHDGNGIDYVGDSIIIDPQGKSLVSANEDSGCFTATLSYQELTQYQQKFPAFLDADTFQIETQ